MKISKLITAICTPAIAAILTACFGTSEPLTNRTARLKANASQDELSAYYTANTSAPPG